MLAQVVLDGADDLLQDSTADRWPIAQRLRWLNECQLAIVSMRPDAKAVTQQMLTVAGEIQSIPATAVRLLDVYRNVGGRGITFVSREVLTELTTNWPTEGLGTAIKHYTFDDRIPKEFITYPPMQAGIKVLARFSVYPTPCATAQSAIDLDDVYQPAMSHYIAASALMKDGETASVTMAQGHMQMFMALVSGQVQVQGAQQPGNSQPALLAPERI